MLRLFGGGSSSNDAKKASGPSKLKNVKTRAGIDGILDSLKPTVFFYATEDSLEKVKIPAIVLGAVGGLAVGGLALAWPDVLGVGYGGIERWTHRVSAKGASCSRGSSCSCVVRGGHGAKSCRTITSHIVCMHCLPLHFL